MERDARGACRRVIAATLWMIGLTGFGTTPAALAAPGVPTAPATSADGNYTVTANGCNDFYDQSYICVHEWLEERVEPNGSFTATSGTFTGKPVGVYTYRSADMYCDWYYWTCTTRYSGTVSVTVGPVPGRDPIDVQLRYSYRARVGNVVGDAGTDILIERTGGGEAGNGVIDAVILRQGAGRTFTPVVPTSAQRNAAWAASDLDVAVEDINVDGYVDVVVGNVASAIAGAYDQIVYSSGAQFSETPKGVRALDPSLTQFTGNMLDYMVDNDYFADNAPIVTTYVVYWTEYCPPYWDTSGIPMCYPVYLYYSVVAPDYSVFNAAAVAVWQHEQQLVQGTLSRAQAVDQIAGNIAGMIGVDLGGWDLDEILGSSGPHDDPLWKKGLEGFISIIGIGKAHAQGVDTDKAPRQIARQTNVIYVTGRYVFGRGTEKLHSSLYFHNAGGIPNWYSAFDSDDSLLGDGKLTARTNDPRDNPLLMPFTLGTVTPPTPTSAYYYFFDDLNRAHHRYQSLPTAWLADYDAIPEIPACGGCAGRNSNGYVNGLIRATRGTAHPLPPLDFNAMFGWEFPVEPFYFGL